MSSNNLTTEDLLGYSPEYAGDINPPSSLGASSDPNALAKNISTIMAYIDLLVEGGGRGSKDGEPLGTRSFVKTLGKCKVVDSKDSENGNLMPRESFIDNVPNGEILFLKNSGVSGNKNMRGSIPAIVGQLEKLAEVPIDLLEAITEDVHPPCQKVTLYTKDSKNNVKKESGYIPINEIKRINPCAFVEGKNKVTGETCIESFISANDNLVKKSTDKKIIINDPINKYFLAAFSGLLLYLTYKIYTKNK
tara:strand:- start:666 stop:1412 length:747 start_codon:yes stop_codon:yes gene_type:complete